MQSEMKGLRTMRAYMCVCVIRKKKLKFKKKKTKIQARTK